MARQWHGDLDRPGGTTDLLPEAGGMMGPTLSLVGRRSGAILNHARPDAEDRPCDM